MVGGDSIGDGDYSFSAGEKNTIHRNASWAVTMGKESRANGISSFALGYQCDASNNFSMAVGHSASTSISKSGGDISDNNVAFALGVSGEGNIFEISKAGDIWTKNLGSLESTIPALGAVPIGGIIPYAGSQSIYPPTNWLWCNGGDGLIDPSGGLDYIINPEYKALFLVIGQTYGTKDDNTGFKVPNLQQRYPLGVPQMNTIPNVGKIIETDISGNLLNTSTPIINNIYHGLLIRYIIRYK